MIYVVVFMASALISLGLTWRVKHIAARLEVVDHPGGERKLHATPTPLWGGLGIFGAFLVVVTGYITFAPLLGWPELTDTHVAPAHLMGILGGALWLVIGGMLDDWRPLKPWQQVIWPMLAALTVIGSGVGIEKITNPLGGYIYLVQWWYMVGVWDQSMHYFVVWQDLFTFGWLLAAMYTTKLLDGLDGLVSGMTVIGATIIALLSLFFFVNIPTALLATIIAGIYFGFLKWNWHPAQIFLGEAGSTLAGYFLGVLALISGAKVATTLLILGIPMLDAAWVIWRRVSAGRSPFSGDRSHLHFRLLAAGLSQRQAVLLLYGLAASFGGMALFLQSTQKLYALVFLCVIMGLIGGFLWRARALPQAVDKA